MLTAGTQRVIKDRQLFDNVLCNYLCLARCFNGCWKKCPEVLKIGKIVSQPGARLEKR